MKVPAPGRDSKVELMAAEATGAIQGTAMEISVSKFELLKELTATQGVVERKTTIPILSNFLFEAANDRLTITATDLDLSLRTSCAAKVKREGACTIPARKLYDYVKLLPDGDISIKLLENHWVNIRSGRSNTKMVGMARANFPGLPVFPASGSVKIPAQTLRSMIGRTIFAISNEESRYTLNGGLMVLKPESITMVATDGHRLAHIEKTGENFDVPGENKTLVPKKAMSELYSLLQNSDVEQVEFAKDDSTLFFRIGERLLTSRQLTGQFPNYEAVLPRETTKSVVVQGNDLNTAIQRVAQFADERSRAIRMKLDKNELKISSSSTEAGESEDSIETAYTADPMTIGFNSEYLIDFLKAQSAGEVRLEFKDAQSAGQMRPEDGSDDGFKYRYVVMPMRI
jgi:DNA polymerase III subunit beta